MRDDLADDFRRGSVRQHPVVVAEKRDAACAKYLRGAPQLLLAYSRQLFRSRVLLWGAEPALLAACSGDQVNFDSLISVAGDGAAVAERLVVRVGEYKQ